MEKLRLGFIFISLLNFWPSLFEMFDFNVFSFGDINKLQRQTQDPHTQVQ